MEPENCGSHLDGKQKKERSKQEMFMKTTQKLLMGIAAAGALSLSVPVWGAFGPDLTSGQTVDLGLQAEANGSGASATEVTAAYTVSTSPSGQLRSRQTQTPVPEPATMIAGALLLLPFGASVLRTLRKGRTA